MSERRIWIVEDAEGEARAYGPDRESAWRSHYSNRAEGMHWRTRREAEGWRCREYVAKPVDSRHVLRSPYGGMRVPGVDGEYLNGHTVECGYLAGTDIKVPDNWIGRADDGD